MPNIPKIYIALREVPQGIEKRVRDRLSDERQYKLGRELELEFFENKNFVKNPPLEIFDSSVYKPAFMIFETEGLNDEQILQFGRKEILFKRDFTKDQDIKLSNEFGDGSNGAEEIVVSEYPYQEYEPRIVLFQSLIRPVIPRFYTPTKSVASTVLPIDEAFQQYNSLFTEGVATKAASLDAAVDIVVANIIRASIKPVLESEDNLTTV